MLTRVLKAKLHHAVVTFTDVNYHGSITIDADLLRQSGLLPNEVVLVADCENGNRFETYIIKGEAGTGVVGVNGAAARLTAVGNRIIVMSFVWAEPRELEMHRSRVVICDRANRGVEVVEHQTVEKSEVRRLEAGDRRQ